MCILSMFLFVQKCVCICIRVSECVWRWRWAGCRGLLLLNRSSMLLIKMHSIPLWTSVSLIIKQCSAHQIWELAASVVMLPTYYCYNYQVPVILLVSHLPSFLSLLMPVFFLSFFLSLPLFFSLSRLWLCGFWQPSCSTEGRVVSQSHRGAGPNGQGKECLKTSHHFLLHYH